MWHKLIELLTATCTLSLPPPGTIRLMQTPIKTSCRSSAHLCLDRSSTECLGIHLGAPQSANLGDGNGFVNQTVELREDFGDPILGTCEESLIGGNHLRVFRQNGSEANSGALFLAYVEFT